MQRGLREMMEFSLAIDKILETPIKTISKKDAEKLLRSCGILDKNNNLRPAYKDIIIKDSNTKNDNK